MRILYNLLITITYAFLHLVQFFNKKMRAFVQGRKNIFNVLSKELVPLDKVIWFHCASLGEFEQGSPVMEALRKQLPNYKILVTFFSPSGYEIKKNTPLADVTCYLPFDTPANAKRFITAVNPVMAIFVKYEFWPNYLFQLNAKKIPTILISGLFREGQPFFKWYGSLLRKSIQSIDHFFVQDSNSKNLLSTIAIEHVTVSGDTRFDRVSHQIEMNNNLDFMENFKDHSLCIVCGSTWPEDEAILIDFINTSGEDVKIVIAPHNIDRMQIESFRTKIQKTNVCFSEKEGVKLEAFDVLILDTIGLLSKVYSYANIAYVGGAMGATGLHNILEPATFGVPIIIGDEFEKFPEARRLQQLAGLFSVNNSVELTEIMTKLLHDSSFRSKTGMICGHFVNSNTGATNLIASHIASLYSDGLI